MQVSCHQ